MKIDIAAISLDVKNFRHAEVSDERDALRILIGDERSHKISRLAQDIVEQGMLDPSSLLIVTEDTAHPGKYIALEGNRRITALKTLASPELSQGFVSYPIFKMLSGRFLSQGITQIDCVVLSRKEAAVWIKRKHYKGVGGEGVIQWDAVATARSDAAEGKYTRWMTALAFLEENGVDAEDIRDRIRSKTTTVERVLTSSAMSSVLGVTFKKNAISAETGDTKGLVSLLGDIMEAMADTSFKEPLVSTVAQQEAWLNGFAAGGLKKPAQTPSPSGTPANPSTPQSGQGAAAGKSTSAQPQTAQPQGTTSSTGSSKRPSVGKPRQYLAKKGLRIRNANLNKLYQELAKLKVDTHPFAAASMIRVFLEKATVVFLEDMNVPTLSGQQGAWHNDFSVKLRSKVEAALKQIDPSAADARLQYARQVAKGTADALHGLDQLNRAIHDNTALPAPSESILIWDRYHDYFAAMFDVLENAGK
ncbi:hypothetical protein NMG46_06920 [Mesorhizobium sp. LMG 17147]|uniref:hypothetical protein n=1 Tax=Mesorhizobium sp. LMG 17147 TaxID=2963091 RepID=UPI0020C9D654|nr:hypothetical protein [Mesorhizobium sp. LMG 17147]MCP9229979.1 hypothetical protein [Mesorhizobium sp. LMG 17147]